MNHVYRLVWSHRHNAWLAVSEIARGRKKGGGGKLAAATLCLATVVAQAGPTGGQVVSGSGQISSSGNTTTITQSSQSLSLNWRSFNITPQETVDFLQPSASSVAVNHIFDTNGTAILGHLNANGQLYLINPNGILFGQGSVVNVGGLVAATLNPTNTDPNATTRSFSGSGTGSVSNEGTITATPGGYVVLMGNRVSNTGTIVAQMGTVGLGAGSAVTLTFASDKLINVQVDASTLNNLAANGGLIQADGGKVIMTAGARDALLASAVNNTGVVEARTVEDHDGTITLLAGAAAGQVNVGGTLDATAPNGGNGGAIETSGAQVSVANNARITTRAPKGLTGSWLVDPQDFTVAASGGDITGSALSGELATTNVQLQSSSGGTAGTGNVNVNDAVSWSANTTLTLAASNNVNVNANITATGATAGLVINPNTANGSESASGTGVFALNNGAVVTLSGTHPSLSISGQAYTVINTLGAQGSTTGADLQGINGNLSGYYALGSDIDATATSSWNSGAGFTPIGGTSSPFSGTFNGLGHTIGHLTINSSGFDLGLLGVVSSSGIVTNVGLVAASVTGNGSGGNVGALVGLNYGTVSNSYSSGTVSGSYGVGGLVGTTHYASIANSYSTATVTSQYSAAGGLVGWAYHGTIINSHATGSVSSSSYATGGLAGGAFDSTISNGYATGTVTANGTYGRRAGGLVGAAYGTTAITNSYATGAASGNHAIGGLIGADLGGTVSNSYATGAVSVSNGQGGGLIGVNLSSSTVSNTWSTGTVTGSGGQIGGLVGANYGTVTNSFWNTTTSGLSSSSGGTGLTTTQMQTAANFTGFNFTTTPGASGNNWVMVDTDGTLNNAGGATGATYPMLASEYSTNVTNAHQLQLMAMALSASYTLSADIDATATASNHDVWVGSTGFIPIATINSTEFTGTLNGQGHTIDGLSVNSSHNGSGLFTASSGTIENVGLVGGSVTGGWYWSGGLVGRNDGTIANSYVTGSVLAGNYTGGLAGTNAGTISNSYSTATVNAASTSGGLVGANYGTISNSYATGTVNGAYRIGGLVGGNFFTGSSTSGVITGSHSSGTVNAAGSIGGLVGGNYGTVSNSFSSSAVNGGSYSSNIGGLVGTNRSGTVSNSYATGAVTASTTSSSNVGGLVGQNYGESNSTASITNSYATGTVTGTVNVGGLVGQNMGYGNTAAISNSYATGTVTGTSHVGGLVGQNFSYGADATISNSYATGAVTGPASSNNVGGLVGYNYGGVPMMGFSVGSATITNSYATGAVSVGSGSSSVGGLIGASIAIPQGSFTPTVSVTNSYWDTTTTGQSTSGGGTGLSTAQMQQQSNFSGWDFSGTWIVYNGLTDPLLRSFMTPLTVTAANASQTYNGTGVVVGNGVTYSATPNSNLLGTLSYSASPSGTLNVGAYSITPQGLYSAQQGYAIDFVSGTLTVNPATLTVTGTGVANKTYDGTTMAGLSGGTLSGVIGSDAVTLTQAGTFASANVGTGIGVTATDSLSGTAAVNYTLVQPTGLTGNITPATLTVTGTNVANKVYDGTTATSLSGGTLSGIFGSDVVTLTQAGAFASPNAGTGVAVTVSDSLGGTAAGNYTLAQPTGLTANITPAILTVTGTNVANKVYDGTTAASLSGGTVSGVIASDVVTLTQAGAFASSNAGTGVAVNASDSLGGAAAGNYTLAQPTGLTANITPASLTVTGTNVANKVYDGTTAASLSGGTLSGLIGSDVVTLTQVGAFVSPNAGTGVAVTASDSLGGTSAGNYTLSQPAGLTANITPASLTVIGTKVANKVYDGTTATGLSGGTLSGIIGSDAVTLTQAGTFVSPNAGTGVAVNASDSLGGTAASNYTLAQPTGLAANISPATLTYNASASASRSGNTPSGLTGTVSGFVSDDTLANATTGTLAWTTPATASSTAGSYAIDGSGLSATNYVFTQNPANTTALTVAPPVPLPTAIAGLESNVLPTGAPTFTSADSGTGGGMTSLGINVDNEGSNSAPTVSSPIDPNGKGKLVIEDLGVKLPADAAGIH